MATTDFRTEAKRAVGEGVLRGARSSEPSFYTWRKRLVEDQPTRFALVATNGTAPRAPALQVVLGGGERLEIPPGVDVATLRTVLALLREGA